MALSPKSKIKLNQAAGRLISGAIRLVEQTSTTHYERDCLPNELLEQHPAIIACWHGQFMMLCCLNTDGAKVSAMVARHGDAELIGEAMKQFDVELIRGAGAGNRKKDRGGARALRASVKALKGGSSLVMTADIPPGPARIAGEGIMVLARMSGRPIIPVAAATSRFKALKTWSRMTINLPFSKLAFAAGQPIHVPRDADAQTIETLRQTLQAELNDATNRAYALAGANVSRIDASTPQTPIKRSATTVSNRLPHSSPATRMTPSASTAQKIENIGMGLKTYRAVTTLLRPTAPVLLKLRERQGKEDARRRTERLGEAGVARPDGQLVWIHAASVGETNAVLPLIDKITRHRPEHNFLLTTGTMTSAGLALKRLGPSALHQYLPLDAPGCARKFLAHWRPDLAIFTESEIWPNLILETSNRNIPLAIVNARMSQRSFDRWHRRPNLSRPLFSRFDLVLAQNEQMGTHFSNLGAKQVSITGNLKIDCPPPPTDDIALEQLRDAIAGRPAYVAASTHPGEDEIIAEAHRAIARRLDKFLTIIAPRHPERGIAIAEMLRSQGLTVAQRSSGALPTDNCDIYIADTIGELGTLYALCPIAFVGGSLVNHGGQNPIEAIKHGAVVLTGPNTHNFRDAYQTLGDYKAVTTVHTADALANAVTVLSTNETELARTRQGAEQALETLAGALERTVDALLQHMPGQEGLRRAS